MDVTAWEAFRVTDGLLFASGAVGIGVLLITASQGTAAVGIATQALAFLVTAPVAVAAAIRVLNLPGDLDAIGAGRTAAAWIGLLAAIGVAVGALVAMRDERLSTPGGLTDSSGVPVDAAQEIETLPAPPRGTSS